MLETSLTRLLGCRRPIQQAGMGVVTSPDLVVAVAEAGGIGMLPIEAPAHIVARQFDELGRRTKGAFGANMLIPFLDREAVAEAARRCRLVEFFYGEPDSMLVDLVHQEGALAAWQVGSLAEAEAAVVAGCDVVIAQGMEAGGHVRGTIGLLPLLQDVVQAVDVPVIAAGGIGNARGIAAALAAGAAGVRLGTVFAASAESAAHPDYVEALCLADAGDTVLTEAFSVLWPEAPHRVLRSAVEAAVEFKGEYVGEVDMGAGPQALERFHVVPPNRSATGEIRAMALYAGQSVGAVDRVRPAGELLQELATEAERLLRRFSG
jgi:NAD(P)H-dependent flavin oxidoreductase YrpB (nitropropane dioxygenase family)